MTEIRPGDIVHYRFGNLTRLRVETVQNVIPHVWELTGRRITKEGNVNVRDIATPFSTSVQEQVITKIIRGGEA